ncbi:DUF296 domain-containing protein [Herbaspirillum lusitanum]|jgi:predicted DNA-binding protein with PD1-like motif|uniref:DUF296 domain-containing protein n=1 Tax=Herbaspirillum lusitanum TaxID=213312 RepID=A0ABW9AAB0_9BURK
MKASLQPDRPRLLIHPGPAHPVRIESRQSRRGRHVRLTLAPGANMFDAIILPLAAIGIEHASTTILGGDFEQIEYCVAQVDPSGQTRVGYAEPLRAGRSCLIFGNATIGKNQQGAPIIHCHGALRAENGAVKGGHILTQNSIVGARPISVLVTAFTDIQLRVAYDAETNISLIKPYQETTNE